MITLEKEKRETFTKEWWVNFLKKNQNFTETCVFKDAISPQMVEILHKGVMEVLRERLTHKQYNDGFRIYLDGVEQDDDYYKNLAINPPKETEDILQYAQRTFDKKFGIIINFGEKHSDLIAENIRIAVAPLIELVGLPPLGLEITIFIGDYGWTPLGIHQDHRGENVLHFHLGPGGKKMYTWEDKKYKELSSGKFNNKDIEPLLEHAKEYPFEAGDLYYMPWFKHHVGYTGELSVGVTLWFNNPTKYSYANQILNSIKNQYLQKAKDIIPNQMDYIESDDALNEMMSILKIDNNLMNSSFADVLKHTQEEFKYSLMSNGGWQNVPLSLDLKKQFKVDAFEELRGRTMVSKAPFQILYKQDNNELFVYVRGSKIRLKYFKELVDIIEALNSHKVIEIDELLSAFSAEFPPSAGLYFISLILNKRGAQLL